LYDKLEKMVSDLGQVQYCDIEVKLFQTLIDGVAFGLVPEPKFGFIELQPNSALAFPEPWDGSYCT